VDAVGAHQQAGLHAVAVREPRLDVVAVIGQPDQAVAQMDALGRERARQRRQQVGAVDLVMREAEGGLDRLGQGRAQQRAAVVPAALVPRQRLDSDPGQLSREPSRCRMREAFGLTCTPAPTSPSADACS
jgi:hypothetical protein